MPDFIIVYFRRLKWDILHYSRYYWRDIVFLTIMFFCGLALGISITVSSNIVNQCVFIKIISGTYSPIGIFLVVSVYGACSLALISFTGFFKFYRFLHCIIIMYWGYRLGIDIISVTTVFIGYFSVIFIYIPYHFLSVCVYISMIIYIRIAIPSPRPNWWCFSPCLFRITIKRGIYLMIPLTCINMSLYVVIPVVFQIFSIVI